VGGGAWREVGGTDRRRGAGNADRGQGDPVIDGASDNIDKLNIAPSRVYGRVCVCVWV
jgi:hypothetical protein